MKNIFKSLIVLVLVVISFSSCNSDDEPDNTKGTVNVKLTDGPFPFSFATEANVTVDKIELKNENGEFVTVFEGNSSFNMVNLTNGTTVDVESTKLEPGTYAQVRITTSDASVHFDDGRNVDDATSQIKTVDVKPALVVEVGTTSDVLIDLDLNESFSFSGTIGVIFGWIPNSGFIDGCHFHPHFRACDVNQTGEIEGTVRVGGELFANADVSVEVDGNVIHTHSEADGTFKFIGIKEGTYTVTVDTQNDGSAQVGEITVQGTGTTSCAVEIN